jgi:hypothetical protein
MHGPEIGLGEFLAEWVVTGAKNALCFESPEGPAFQFPGSGEATALFGQERSDQLPGILDAIEQTFGGEPL